MKKALKESPIRTKYKPEVEKELQHIEDADEQDIARNLLKIARRFDRAQSEVDDPSASKNLTASESLSRLPTGTFSQLLPGAQDHETVSANLLRTLNTVNQEDADIKRNLRPGAVSELNRYWSMKHIKEICGVQSSDRQSDFHSMRDKGMFFCGYQDISMKKQGLPSVFAAEGEIADVVSSDDESALVDTSRRAIDSPEEDRKVMLHRVKGTTVMRRAPEQHEATLSLLRCMAFCWDGDSPVKHHDYDNL